MRTPSLALVFCTFVAACGGDAFTGAALVGPELDAGAAGDAAPPPLEASQPAADAPAVLDGSTVDGVGVEAALADVGGHPDGGGPGLDAPPAVDRSPDPPDTALPPAIDGAADAPVCDLKPCQCGGIYVPLCCDGPCPPGFEGLTCYCGQCPFPKTAGDAGRCE